MSSFESLVKQIGSENPQNNLNAEFLVHIWSNLGHLETLDNLQYLHHLWTSFNHESSDEDVLCLILLIVFKYKSNPNSNWSNFLEETTKFHDLTLRTLKLFNQTNVIQVKWGLIHFFGVLVSNLNIPSIRREMGPLFNIAIWSNLQYKEELVKKYQFDEPYSKQMAKSEINGEEGQVQRTFLYNFIVDLIRIVANNEPQKPESIKYIEVALEVMIDILSQLPTRHFTNTLIKELNVLAFLKLSPMRENWKICQLSTILEQYMYFPINDFTGADEEESNDSFFFQFQKSLFKEFSDNSSIKELALIPKDSSTETRFRETLAQLSHEDLLNLASSTQLQVRSDYDSDEYLIESMITKYLAQTTDISKMANLAINPNETLLFDGLIDCIYNTDSFWHSLPVFKLASSYLSMNDFLVRSIKLSQIESFLQIRKELEAVLKRAKISTDSGRLTGNSKKLATISKFDILEISEPTIGSDYPSMIKAEVIIDTSKISGPVIAEWNHLKQGDSFFLVQLAIPKIKVVSSNSERFGLKVLRSVEIIEKHAETGGKMKFIIKLDSEQYSKDKPELYESLNYVIRRSDGCDFSTILSNLKSILEGDSELPNWFQDLFLGVDSPTAASYINQPNRPTSLKFDNTFNSWDHLESAFPNKKLTIIENAEQDNIKKRKTDSTIGPMPDSSSNKPPYVLDLSLDGEVKVISYNEDKQDNEPRPSYSPEQIEAIISGMSTGLTIINGAPGTGKTTILSQVLNNIYHNFSEERTVIITSDETRAEDIHSRILGSRLHVQDVLILGDEMLKDTEMEESTDGVDKIISKVPELLSSVRYLADCLNLEGAYDESCEVAGYFFDAVIHKLWVSYLLEVEMEKTAETVINNFPFAAYFSDLKFNSESSFIDNLKIAISHYGEIHDLFKKIQLSRPLELLATRKAKADYMLYNQARVIIIPEKVARLTGWILHESGFKFNNLILPDSGKLNELGSILPLTFQRSSGGLKRIIMIGDQVQDFPLVSSLILKNYSRLGQSMLNRLLQLGVPQFNLIQQGSVRPEICNLYKHAYNDVLTNFPSFESSKRYTQANAGFESTYQFIDVDLFEGNGEIEPVPGYFQNIGEAEYAVALFSYMRLLGYPNSKITILAMYEGQKMLIEEILSKRCGEPTVGEKDVFKFGWPVVSTVDAYQGKMNDYVILSLVRTETLGEINNVSRLTTALSSGMLGLYVLGYKSLYNDVIGEISPFFQKLVNEDKKPEDVESDEEDDDEDDEDDTFKLKLVIGELYGRVARTSSEEPKQVYIMEDVEHFSDYVSQMTKTRVSHG